MSQPLRILLVEDHHDTRKVINRLLVKCGHTVTVAEDAAGAVKAAAGGAFDIAFIDIGLPDRDGKELMRELAQSHSFKAVALTGYGMPDDIQECLQAGFTAHLLKPIEFKALEQVIERFQKSTS